MHCIYDLDGTVICSKHRKATLPDGSLDLEHWIENNTPDKIAKDSLLPLFNLMQKNWRNGHTIVICTARVLTDSDYEFFMEHGIMSHKILSRPDGCTMQDHILKDIQLRLYAQENDLSWKRFCSDSVVYDDNANVIDHLASIGMNTRCAVKLNKVLAV